MNIIQFDTSINISSEIIEEKEREGEMKGIEMKINVLTYRLEHDNGMMSGEQRFQLQKQLHEYELQKIRLEYEYRLNQQQKVNSA